MNALFGMTSDPKNMGAEDIQAASGKSWGYNGAYRQYLKQSDVLNAATTWVTLDESADSINDGFFITGYPGATQWGDLPASYHNGACGFSFADGHAEIHKWKSSTSVYSIHFDSSLSFLRPFDAIGRTVDYQWYTDHTGYILYR